MKKPSFCLSHVSFFCIIKSMIFQSTLMIIFLVEIRYLLIFNQNFLYELIIIFTEICP
jgi:hypothetical protein